MNSLIEDCISSEERRSIATVLASNELRFDRLVGLAGLDPRQDFQHSDLRNLNFCGADLRGFNFSGSDLRGSVVDERTLMDETTILFSAKVDWVSERDIPIVLLMQEVNSASHGKQRREALSTLEKKYGKTDHVISFVVNASAEAATVDAYLDFADFLPSGLTDQHRTKAVDAGVRVVSKKLARSRSRTGRNATTIFAAEKIAERLSAAEGSFAADWFRSLAEVVDADKTNDALSGTVANLDQSHLLTALKALRSTIRNGQ